MAFVILTLICIVLDILALPVLINFRYGPGRNQHWTSKDKVRLIFAFNLLLIRVAIYNAGFSLLAFAASSDMETSLNIFVSGIVQGMFMWFWRDTFKEYSSEDDEVACDGDHSDSD